MDATPLTLGQEFSGYETQVHLGHWACAKAYLHMERHLEP